VAISALCATGVALCRELMLDQLQRHLPEGQKIKHPHLSYKYSEIVRLHAQFYPESQIRVVSRFLFGTAALTMDSLIILSLVLVIFRQAAVSIH
jgi:hypothetical protein